MLEHKTPESNKSEPDKLSGHILVYLGLVAGMFDEPDAHESPPRLLLDSRVVDVLRSSNLIVVTLSSLQPFFFNGLKKA
jgi:hypothetical protein